MKKVILDFGSVILRGALTRRDIHKYIAKQMDFPAYYGHNLDALYDCLTDLAEPTAVCIMVYNMEESAAEERYLEKVRKTFADAENDNPNLAVFDLLMIPRGAKRPPVDEDD